jgi:hypothetical protein
LNLDSPCTAPAGWTESEFNIHGQAPWHAGLDRVRKQNGATIMNRIVRFEFLGKRWLFWLLCFTGIGIPYAILYLLEGTVWVEEELENPGAFLEAFRAGRLGHQR